MNNLHAKALRAAEWLETQGYTTRYREFPNGDAGWNAEQKEPTEKFCRMSMKGSDRIMIAFCEDRGWIDTAEDEGVEWVTLVEQSAANAHDITIRRVGDQWEWSVWLDFITIGPTGYTNTQKEARERSVEAAQKLTKVEDDPDH